MTQSLRRRPALLAGVLVCTLGTGCTSSGTVSGPGRPEPKPGAPGEAPAETPPPGGRGPAVTYKAVRDASYRLEHHDSLSLQYPGGAVQEQVRNRVAFFRLTLAQAPEPDNYRVTVVLDSLQATESGQPVAPDSVAGARGTVWTGTVTDRGQLSQLSSNRSSTLSDELGSRIPLLFPVLPPGGVREGMEWTDTTQRKVVADAFPVTQTAILTYRATDTTELRSRKAIALESSGTYSRSGTRVQGDQELQMTATGNLKEVHNLGLDGALVSAEGTESGDMTISVPALGQTVPVRRSSRYAISSTTATGH